MLRGKVRLATQLSGIAAVVLLFFAWYPQQGYPQKLNADIYSKLKYRFIGPAGNRASAVVGVPGDPNIYYLGASSGGIWKSNDGAFHWLPIFDDQPVSSIGALAVATSNSNIVWAGTGETFIRSNISIGNGIYKSADGGKTWTRMGLERTGRIGRIVIDPHNPDIVFAAAMGHCYGPQPERGVFRTINGGKTWERVLFVDEKTGCSGIVMDPNNPQILFAGMWQLVIRTWGRQSGGSGSGLYISKDGGTTWNRLSGHVLPSPPLGKVTVAVALNNSNRVYALIETGDGVPWKGLKTSSGVLWRSEDGGENWALVNHDHRLTQRPHYYTRLVVAPDDYNEIYFLAPDLWRSLDGGETFEEIGQDLHEDHHDMWIDPANGNRMIECNDEIFVISVNRGKFWFHPPIIPIAQMYHVGVDNQIPYFVYGNRQDGPSTCGHSNSLLPRGIIPKEMWHGVGGCESGFAIPDPVDSNIVWASYYDGGLDRFDLRTRHVQSVRVWPESKISWPPADLKYRFQWTFPIVISPHDHNKVYVGSQYVHQTINGGQSWAVISPDLSTNDKSKQQSSGGLAPDNVNVDYCCSIFALAESPLEEGLIWAGTNDGLVQVTRDGGAHWTNVTGNIPNLPLWGTVSNIEPSRHDAGTCYITVDFHQVNNREPYVYKTTDYGKNWKSIRSDILKSVFSYAHCICEDSVRKGLLYLGTENTLYVSFNDGASWIPLQNNLPHAPVHWMVIQEHFNDMVVVTYGRGFWILDDITPLQQLTLKIIKSDAYLFGPRPEKSKEPKLRTSPLYAPHVMVGPQGWRSTSRFRPGGGKPLVVPGIYIVKLIIDGQEFSQKLAVKKDPKSAGSEADIQAQVKMLLEIRDNINLVVDIIDQTELIRKQIYDLIALLEGNERSALVISAAYKLDKKLINVDENFFQMRLTGPSSDHLRYPMKLYGKLHNLADGVYYQGGSDFPPTTQELEVHEMFKNQLAAYQNQLNELLNKDLATFNNLLKEKNIPNIIVIRP